MTRTLVLGIIAGLIAGFVLGLSWPSNTGGETPSLWVAVAPSQFMTFPASGSGQAMRTAGVTPAMSLTPAPSRTPVPSASPSSRKPSGVGTTVKPKPTAKPSAGHFLVSGWATYYPARNAAAGAYLAKAMGGGRKYLGQSVRVWFGKDYVDVRLGTSCACGDRHGEHTVIDLPTWAFASLADTGTGVIHVKIERLPR